MVISIAAFAPTEEMRNELQKGFDAREIALVLVYRIPGYKEAGLETKNFIYDAVSKKVLSLME